MRSPKQFFEEFVTNLIIGRRESRRRPSPEPYEYKPPASLVFQGDAERLSLTRSPSPVRRAVERMDEPSCRASLDTLPTEIRQLIWKHVIENHAFHLVFEKDHPEYMDREFFHPEKRKLHLVGYMCKSPDPTACQRSRWNCIPFERWCGPWREQVSGILCLLLASKQIYRESIDMLYTANTFIMEDRYDNMTLSYLPFALPTQRFHAIRSLRLSLDLHNHPPLPLNPAHSDQKLINRQLKWTTIWDVLASMSGLENLEVELVVGFEWNTLNKESAEILLAPIKKITGPKRFVLSLPFPAMREAMKPATLFSYGATRGWEGCDPWDELHCTIERLEGERR